jgi:hypothetical protein
MGRKVNPDMMRKGGRIETLARTENKTAIRLPDLTTKRKMHLSAPPDEIPAQMKDRGPAPKPQKSVTEERM